jgi:FkbM family methyltransferase
MIQSIKRKLLNKGAYFISYFKLKKILKNINSSSLVIDCGANIGDISALFLSKKARVIAFEPDPLAFKALQNRFKGNPNIECINKGVSDRAGKAKFFLHKSRTNHSGDEFTVSSSIVKEKINIDTANSIEIELVDLSEFIVNLNCKADIVKLDVEGAEIEILEKIISEKVYHKIGLMLVETHETKIPGHDKKVAHLKAALEQENIGNIKLNWI